MDKPTLMDSILNAQDTPAVIIDTNYLIIAANEAYCASYGIDQKSIVGRHCHEISHRSAVPCHLNGEDCPHKEVMATHAPFDVMHTHFDRDGAPDYVRIKAYPLNNAAGQPYLLETIHRLAAPIDMSCEEMRMVGRSPAFLACIENLSVAARYDAPVLIQGESGVGKELAARFLHDSSARSKGPFIELNCAAIPEQLCESELFGHEKGAFTGSNSRKEGLFELANNGTLFLDEIGDLSLPIQAKLLKVLDSGDFRRVGDNKVHHTNCRIITATNRDLSELICAKLFREDLYFRIAALPVEVPSLRARRADIAPLSQALIDRLGKTIGRQFTFSHDAVAALENHTYPGNIRELYNILCRAGSLARDGIICSQHLKFEPAHAPHAHVGEHAHASTFSPAHPATSRADKNLGQSMAELERQRITELLEKHTGNRRAVAHVLGISERTLYRKLQRYASSDLNATH